MFKIAVKYSMKLITMNICTYLEVNMSLFMFTSSEHAIVYIKPYSGEIFEACHSQNKHPSDEKNFSNTYKYIPEKTFEKQCISFVLSNGTQKH